MLACATGMCVMEVHPLHACPFVHALPPITLEGLCFDTAKDCRLAVPGLWIDFCIVGVYLLFKFGIP